MNVKIEKEQIFIKLGIIFIKKILAERNSILIYVESQNSE